jgi:hypothetical protein
MAKLTLSVDDRVVSTAKQYARQQGLSVSEIVERYLAAISEAPPAVARPAPVLRSLRGVLRKADISDYRKHLASKYR